MCNIPLQLPVNGAVDNTHYTTFAWTEKQSQLEMLAVNSWVLCTLNARNELSQHGVHDEQTVTLLPHYITQTCLQCARTPLLPNKQTQCNICWCTHQQAEHTHHFHFTFISSILSSWALSSTLLLHTASWAESLPHISQRLLHFIGQWKHEHKLKVGQWTVW